MALIPGNEKPLLAAALLLSDGFHMCMDVTPPFAVLSEWRDSILAHFAERIESSLCHRTPLCVAFAEIISENSFPNLSEAFSISSFPQTF